ncbi:thioether cross-link-forming SCIFF peptide maturase [Proteinivorax hydrogeniformans]|uniref:Thioether cross-link-forming SCIFF peptide maturase n=1 Tax=Proteinivorax hydrogeniformans TaxID=1826727 RepID=A0AAU8HSA3_9FIRM
MRAKNFYKFKKNQVNILLDIPTSTVHVIDDVTSDVIDCIEQKPTITANQLVEKLSGYDSSQIEGAYNELLRLHEQGNIFNDEKPSELPRPNKDIIKAMCLHVAHDCNMRCKYCFASSGNFGGKSELMDLKTAKKAIDFLVEKSNPRKNCEVDFFGGEPLLNLDMLEELVKYIKEQEVIHDKNIRMTLTTNGLDLNEKAQEFLNENDIATVLSLDGREDVNNNMRKTDKGHKTYSTIVANYKSFLQKRQYQNYYLRGTFTKENLDFCEDVKHIVDLGFEEVSMEPVVEERQTSYTLTEKDLNKVKDEYWKLTEFYLKKEDENLPFNFFHFNINLDGGPCSAKRVSGCGAGVEYVAVAPNGDLYPCHQFVGDESFKVGDVYNKEIDSSIADTFFNTTMFTKDACRTCWSRYFCGGGCHANAHQINGNLTKPYSLACEMQKVRTECSLYIEAVKALRKAK